MIYLNKFDTHASYESELNVGGGVDISLPNVSYCEDVKDVHYLPYNLVRFYVGEITTSHTVSIYTDSSTSIPIQISEGNKWYSYVLPKDKGLFKIEGSSIEGDSVKKVVVKANISTEFTNIIPFSTVEASFKGSDTSKLNNMMSMFYGCSSLTSLNLTGWNTSNVTYMSSMFYDCNGLISLDLSSFNTSNVTDMPSMFSKCSGLTSLDLSKWDTSKLNNMSSMFYGCSGLTSLDLSGWDTSKVTEMSDTFRGCPNSLEIIMKGCSKETIDKIKAQLTKDNITGFNIIQ